MKSIADKGWKGSLMIIQATAARDQEIEVMCHVYGVSTGIYFLISPRLILKDWEVN